MAEGAVAGVLTIANTFTKKLTPAELEQLARFSAFERMILEGAAPHLPPEFDSLSIESPRVGRIVFYGMLALTIWSRLGRVIPSKAERGKTAAPQSVAGGGATPAAGDTVPEQANGMPVGPPHPGATAEQLASMS